MSEDIPEWAVSLRKVMDENFKTVTGEIVELKKQVGINCNKLDSMDTKLDDADKKLDSIVEIVTANGQGIEVISDRVDKLEKRVPNKG